MLNEQTINQLTEMRLHSMAKAFREQMQDSSAVSGLSFEDRFGLIVDRQWTDRNNNHISRLIKSATLKFPYASIENIRYDDDRNLDRNLISQLASGQYIKNKNNIIVTGASGAGKTYMGCAFGVSACRQLYKVKYIRLPELLEDLNIARGEGLYKKTVASYKKYRVLIFDIGLCATLGC